MKRHGDDPIREQTRAEVQARPLGRVVQQTIVALLEQDKSLPHWISLGFADGTNLTLHITDYEWHPPKGMRE